MRSRGGVPDPAVSRSPGRVRETACLPGTAAAPAAAGVKREYGGRGETEGVAAKAAEAARLDSRDAAAMWKRVLVIGEIKVH